MSGKNPERVIRAETIVDASLDEVWDTLDWNNLSKLS
jgi:hypothetical protein